MEWDGMEVDGFFWERTRYWEEEYKMMGEKEWDVSGLKIWERDYTNIHSARDGGRERGRDA
jgi:hypothetical protein